MIKKIFVVFFSLGLYSITFAQQNMTLYQMHEITQSNSLNPAIPGDCKWNIGFPGLGNISIAASSPVSYNDLGAGQDVINGDQLLSLLKPENLLATNISLNLLTVGYRMDNTYFQFTMDEKVSAKISFSKNLLEFLLKGNAQFTGQTVEGEFASSSVYYREYGLNIAHDFGNDTWLGVRAKILSGRLAVHSDKNFMSLYTEPATYALTLKSDLLIRASIPGTVEINPVTEKVTKFNHEIEAKHFIFNPINIGGAVDLGINKDFESGWNASASLLNIGVINWNTNVHSFTQRATLNYNGPTASINNWNDFLDTIKSVGKFNYRGSEIYSQWLSPALMVGANYPVAEYVRLGLTGYAELSFAGVPWALTATALTDKISNFYGAISYTVTNNSFVNVGVGLGGRVGAFNIHLITDNVFAIFSPTSQKYATLQFGINFKFGCGEGGGGKSKKYSSIPCPSYKSSTNSGSIPCPSGRKQ
jgi:hypothetical protein